MEIIVSEFSFFLEEILKKMRFLNTGDFCALENAKNFYF